MRSYLGIGLFWTIFTVTACEGPDVGSEPIDFEGLIGTYRANFGSAQKDEIVLRRDSTYLHTYVTSKGEMMSDSGSFEFVDQGHNTYLLYIPEYVVFLPVGDRCVGQRSRNPSEVDTLRLMVMVKKSKDRQVLDYCPDERNKYIKVH